MKMSEIVTDGRRRYGEKFDPSDLAPQFLPFYGTDARIRVQRGDFVRTGRVGKTTGWKPAFLLMHRSSDIGSWDLLSADDEITHVQIGRTYKPVTVSPSGLWSVKQ